jgi:hypothetical protein
MSNFQMNITCSVYIQSMKIECFILRIHLCASAKGMNRKAHALLLTSWEIIDHMCTRSKGAKLWIWSSVLNDYLRMLIYLDERIIREINVKNLYITHYCMLPHSSNIINKLLTRMKLPLGSTLCLVSDEPGFQIDCDNHTMVCDGYVLNMNDQMCVDIFTTVLDHMSVAIREVHPYGSDFEESHSDEN